MNELFDKIFNFYETEKKGLIDCDRCEHVVECGTVFAFRSTRTEDNCYLLCKYKRGFLI